MTEALSHDDVGTRLDASAAAMTWHPDEGYRLVVPKMDEEVVVPEGVLLLSACMVLSRDPEWVAETIAAIFDGEPT